MNFDGQDTGLDYYPCTYGKSRTMFRGPRVSLDGPYTVVIGSLRSTPDVGSSIWA